MLGQAVSGEPTMGYHKVRVISGQGSGSGQFAESLRGLGVDAADRIYAVGDAKVCVFAAAGELLQSAAIGSPGYCVAVAADGQIYVGQEGQVQILDSAGKSFDSWCDDKRLGLVTAIAIHGDEVFIGDVQDRCIRRYDRRGKFRNDVGKDNRMRGFLLPNRHLDFAVSGDGVIHAANPGHHRVERYTPDGRLLDHFGRFDGIDPAGFPGCCNPTNIALAPGGDIVVTEKAGPRVKVYSSEGELRTIVATDDFDLNCKNMDVAVDAHGRIYVIDTVRLHIVVYEPEGSAARQTTTATSREVTP